MNCCLFFSKRQVCAEKGSLSIVNNLKWILCTSRTKEPEDRLCNVSSSWLFPGFSNQANHYFAQSQPLFLRLKSAKLLSANYLQNYLITESEEQNERKARKGVTKLHLPFPWAVAVHPCDVQLAWAGRRFLERSWGTDRVPGPRWEGSGAKSAEKVAAAHESKTRTTLPTDARGAEQLVDYANLARRGTVEGGRAVVDLRRLMCKHFPVSGP